MLNSRQYHFEVYLSCMIQLLYQESKTVMLLAIEAPYNTWKEALVKGTWVVINRLDSRFSMGINIVRILIPAFITDSGPPNITYGLDPAQGSAPRLIGLVRDQCGRLRGPLSWLPQLPPLILPPRVPPDLALLRPEYIRGNLGGVVITERASGGERMI